MENIKKQNTLSCILVAFICSALVLLILVASYTLVGVIPFDDISIIRHDALHQYIPFHTELRRRVLEGRSLLYSWNDGLGKNLYTQILYYTMSPFGVLTLFFKPEQMYIALTIESMIKVGCCGATSTFYLLKQEQNNEHWAVAFGVLYASCGFIVAYAQNLMWLDALILYPIALYGLEKVFRNESITCYYTVLTLSIITNFYMAFFVCMGLGIHFIYLFVTENNTNRKRSTYRFILVTAEALMTAAFVLLPAVLALRTVGSSVSGVPTPSIYENIVNIGASHFLQSRLSVITSPDDTPNLYSGVLPMILLPIYFMNKDFSKREKVMTAGIMTALLLSTFISIMNYVAQCLHTVYAYPHRFVFIYTLLVLRQTYRALVHIKSCDIKARHLILTGVFYLFLIGLPFVPYPENVETYHDIAYNITFALLPALICLVLIHIHRHRGARATWIATGNLILLGIIYAVMMLILILPYPKSLTFKGVHTTYSMVLNIVLIILYIALVYLYRYKPKGVVTVLILLLVVYEGLTENNMVSQDVLKDISQYTTEAHKITEATKDIHLPTFQRVTVRSELENAGGLCDFDGVSQFSSMATHDTMIALACMGVPATPNIVSLYNSTPLIDAVLGVGYTLRGADDMPIVEYADKLGENEGISIYENDKVLPLGFMVDKDILTWKTKGSRMFDVQNSFIKATDPTSGELFTALPIDRQTTSNITLKETEPNTWAYKVIDPTDMDNIPTVDTTYIAKENDGVYLWVLTEGSLNIDYSIGSGQTKTMPLYNVVTMPAYVGKAKPGEDVNVHMGLNLSTESHRGYVPYGDIELLAGCYHQEVFNKWHKKMSQHPYTITHMTDTHVEGTVNSTGGVLFTSIPNVDGWHAKVDGESVETLKLGSNAFIGLELPEGEHFVEFDFRVPGLVISLPITFLGLVAFFITKSWGNFEKP